MRAGTRRSVLLSALAVAVLLSAVFASGAQAARPVRIGGMTGVVLDHGGGALPGATVTAYALPGLEAGCPEVDDRWAPAASTTTGTGGGYTLAVGPGVYRIGVRPPNPTVDSHGYRVASVQTDGSNVTSFVKWADDVVVGTAMRTGLDLRLSTPAAITGLVTEGDSSGPGIAGIEVRAVLSQGWGGQMQRLSASARTGADGRYSVAGLPTYAPDPNPSTPHNEALVYGLFFVDPAGWHGYLIWWHTLINETPDDDVAEVDVSTTDRERSVSLPRSGRITGTVTNPKGRPIAGIAIDHDPAYPEPPVYTDAKGRYAIANGPEPTVLRYRDPNGVYRTTWSGGVGVKHDAVVFTGPAVGETKVVNMKLLDGAASLTGLVWYTAGVPAAGAEVSAWAPGHVQDWEWGLSGGTSAACDGTFLLTGLWPGSYTVGFAAPRHYGYDANLPVNVTAGQRKDLGTVMLPSWIIQGQVREPNGSPAAAVDVDLWTEDEGGNRVLVSNRWAHGTTDGNGFFRVFTIQQMPGPYVQFTDPSSTYPVEFWQDKADVWSADPVWDEDGFDDQGQWLNVTLGSPVPRGLEGYVQTSGGDPVTGVVPHLRFVWPDGNVDLPYAASGADGHYVAEVVFSGGLPGWKVEYHYDFGTGDTIIGYYSTSEPDHLTDSYGDGTDVWVQEAPYTLLEVVIFDPPTP